MCVADTNKHCTCLEVPVELNTYILLHSKGLALNAGCTVVTVGLDHLTQPMQDLDLFVNLVHGVSIPGLTTRHNNLDIVVIRWEKLRIPWASLQH
jgi:hypothetical protein